MSAEPTEEDRRAYAEGVVAYATCLARSGLNRDRWDAETLSEVEYAESLMADAITERRARD